MKPLLDLVMRPLVGGALIGGASAAMLLLLGRLTGISGIARGVLQKPTAEAAWRYTFIAGLLAGGALLRGYYPQALSMTHAQPLYILAIGGFLVGYGTTLGNGCTSGHGVCGLGRRSRRSVYATVTFILAGMLTVFLSHGLPRS